jgi:hypothetical protein
MYNKHKNTHKETPLKTVKLNNTFCKKTPQELLAEVC